MRAKLVNKFERGLEPKESMGIGNKYEQDFKKIEIKITDIVQQAFDLGITLKDVEEIFYGATHINTSYSDEAYLKDPNNFD